MTKGISLHIDLNSVNPEHYDGWQGILSACESDADYLRVLGILGNA